MKRSGLGIIIGSINICYYFGLIVYELLDEVESQQQKTEFTQDMYWVGLILLILMVITSCLLVYGIVKKRHGLMVPWLICTLIAIILYCIRFILVFAYVQATMVDDGMVPFAVINCLIIAVHILCLYLVYRLYRNIRYTNLSHHGHIISHTGENVAFATSSAPYNIEQQKI